MHHAGYRHQHGFDLTELDALRAQTRDVAVPGRLTLEIAQGELGDVAAEGLAFLVPAVAVWFGWHSLFDEKMYAVWILDFVFAYALQAGYASDLSPAVEDVCFFFAPFAAMLP